MVYNKISLKGLTGECFKFKTKILMLFNCFVYKI